MAPANKEFRIARLDKEDVQVARDLFILMQHVFEVEDLIEAHDSYISVLLGNDHFICFAAWFNDQLAGGLTAHELPMTHSASSEIFIYDLAVKTEFQRRGCGKRLLQTIKEFAKEKGCDLFVDANIEDHHALAFYRATGAAESPVIQFTYYFNNPDF